MDELLNNDEELLGSISDDLFNGLEDGEDNDLFGDGSLNDDIFNELSEDDDDENSEYEDDENSEYEDEENTEIGEDTNSSDVGDDGWGDFDSLGFGDQVDLSSLSEDELFNTSTETDFDNIENEDDSTNNEDEDFGDLDSFDNFDDTDNEFSEFSDEIIDDDTDYGDNTEDEYDDTEDVYGEGDISEDEEDGEDESEQDITPDIELDTSFMNSTGDIVIQDASDDKQNGFSLTYVNIENIAITQRIRKTESVESLVRSIKSTGLLKPLVVAETATDGLYVLLDGYRRIQACARAGKTVVPCIVNHKIRTPEIPVIEAVYNQYTKYSIQEQIEYINYLEKQKGIMNPSMIEYLLQMESGDYSKLKDVLNDNDEDIVTKLMNGQYDISTAFKKLEQRRKKESAQEKDSKRAEQVFSDEEESGVSQIGGSGEEADGEALTDEQIQALAINVDNIDEGLEDAGLDQMIEKDSELPGFEPHQQKVGEREYMDPIIRKTIMARDNSTCQCCKRGGEQYVDILDAHHVLPVFLGGKDTPKNGVMLCVSCHRLVHLYSTGDLHIDEALLTGSYEDLSEKDKQMYPNEQIFEDEKNRFKRIVKFGSVIRQGIAQKGMNREKYKKEHPNNGIGRRKYGVNAQQEIL